MAKTQILTDARGTYFNIYSQKYGTFRIEISAEDADRVAAHKWHVQYCQSRRLGAKFVVAATVRNDGQKRTLLLHRLILGTPPNPTLTEIDHIISNPLLNTRENLRWVTKSQNQQNRVGARGYHWNKECGKWQAQITDPATGRHKHLGLHDTEAEARQIYLNAKAELHPGNPITAALLSSNTAVVNIEVFDDTDQTNPPDPPYNQPLPPGSPSGPSNCLG